MGRWEEGKMKRIADLMVYVNVNVAELEVCKDRTDPKNPSLRGLVWAGMKYRGR